METLQALLTSSCRRLEAAGVESPRLDAEVLLCRVLNISREEFWRDSSRQLDLEDIKRCEEWIQRREKREPLAYIIGEREFWSRSFKVTPDVLIPRPETELLIEQLLNAIPAQKRNEPLQGLDMCTGSGVLAIISALELPASKIIGTDLSISALAVARENSRRHGVEDRILWLSSDMFGNLGGHDFKVGEIDFILCNPPYIASGECRSLQPEISQFEPPTALDGGTAGLKFFDKILEGAHLWLKPGGRLLMEIGSDQGPAVKTMLMREENFSRVNLHQDYSGRDRAVSARKRTDG